MSSAGEMHFKNAIRYLLGGKYENSLDEITAVLSEYKTSSLFYLIRASLYLQTSAPDKAYRDILRSKVHGVNNSIERLNTLIKVRKFMNNNFYRAFILYLHSDIERALYYLLCLVKNGYDPKKLSQEVRIQEHFLIDSVIWDNIMFLKRFNVSNNNHLYERAELYTAYSNYEQALSELKNLLNKNKSDWKALLLMSKINTIQGKYREADKYWSSAIKINPEIKKTLRSACTQNRSYGMGAYSSTSKPKKWKGRRKILNEQRDI